MRKLWKQLINQHPLTLILSAGMLTLFASGLASYYWADTPPEQDTSLVQKRAEANSEESPSAKPKSNDTSETIPLDPDNWESFLYYEGEREQWLGIKQKYSAVNVRSGPSMEYPVIHTPSGGTLLEPLDLFNNWYRVRLPGGELGWAHRSLFRQLNVPKPVVQELRSEMPPLKESIQASIPQSFRDDNRLEVLEDSVNVRQGPGTQFQIIGRVYRYEQLRLLAREDSWYRAITIRKKTGWIHQSLVKQKLKDNVEANQQVQVKSGMIRLGPRFQFRGQSISEDNSVGTIIDEEGDWIQIQLKNGNIGWVQKSETKPVE